MRLLVSPEARIGATAAAFVIGVTVAAPFLPRGAVVRVLLGFVLGFLVYRHVMTRIAHPLRTASNVVAAIREGDFALRARPVAQAGPLADLINELNALSDHLQVQRVRAAEAMGLLAAISARMDVALLAFTDTGALLFTNPAAARLFPRATDVTAAALGIADWFEGASARTVAIPGQVELSWELRRGTFWRDGRRHVFFLVADARRARREHERVAWQRLIRVIGHEVNNTLTPIQSLASTCQGMLRDAPERNATEVERALALIEQRAQMLRSFITDYARLARLPPPKLAPTRLEECVRTAAALDQRAVVRVDRGPDIVVLADAAQLEQAFVNLIKNAVDAALETRGEVSIGWTVVGDQVVVSILDDGPGIQNPDNLLVPFFSTKPNGSGIGLALSQNIVEGHGGELKIGNRRERSGCLVQVILALSADESVCVPGGATEGANGG